MTRKPMMPPGKGFVPCFIARRDGAIAVHFDFYQPLDTFRSQLLVPPLDLLDPRDWLGAAGFDWGVKSPGTARLGFAMVFRYFEHVGLARPRAFGEALAVYQAFAARRLEPITDHRWSLTVKEIAADLTAIDAERYGARRKEASDV